MFDVCVIGGAGFIGVEVVKQLCAQGKDVLILGRRELPPRQFGQSTFYQQCDISQTSEVRAAVGSTRRVIHLAYTGAPNTGFRNLNFEILQNLSVTVALLETLSELDLDRCVIASSGGTVYGEANQPPITETHPTRPISPYGITKYAIECYAYMLHRISHLPVVIARPSNAYGESQKAFTGQGFIATAVAKLIANEEIEIYGERGTTRDYIHVEDTAAAVIALLQKGRLGEAYNVGTGVGMDNVDIVSILATLALEARIQPPKLKILKPRPFDVAANVLCPTKLINDTGWRPHISVHEGVRRVLISALGGVSERHTTKNDSMGRGFNAERVPD